MPRVFISYRRDDTSGYAGRLSDRLSAPVGRENLFVDVDAIGAGADFVRVIQEAVASCDAFVVLIGKRWLAESAGGASRLEDLDDFVRLELATALERKIPVIPVLVGGAAMPAADELPPDLKDFARRHALELSDTRWEFDVEKLLDALGIEEIAALEASRTPRWRWLLFGLTALVLLGAIFTAVWVVRREGVDAPQEAPSERGLELEVPVVGVMALSNLSGDQSLDKFGEGVATAVHDNLSQSRHLAAVSAMRMARLRSSAANELGVLQAAGAGGVGFVVSGEILPAGEGLTVTARLVDTVKGSNVASRRFDGLTASSLLEVSDRIADLVRQGLDVPRTEQVDVFAADFRMENPAAYEAYIDGLGHFLAFRYPEAERAFEAALRLAPQFTMARYRLAHTQAVVGEREKALDNIGIAASEATKLGDRERLYVLAAQEYLNRRHDEAIELYEELVGRFKYDGEARQLLAAQYFQTRRYEEEVAQLLVLKRFEPDSVVVWGMLGQAYLEMGQLDKAAEAADRLVELDPDSARTHHITGLVYQARGDLERAAREHEQALESDPQMHFATLSLARVEVLRGKRPRAEALLAEMISDAETPPRFRTDAGIAMAHLLRAAGRFADAAEVLESLEKDFRGGVLEASALRIRGLCHLELGQTAAAGDLIERSIERATGTKTRYLLARGLLELQLGARERLPRTVAEILGGPVAGGEPRPSQVRAAAYLRGVEALALGDPVRARGEFELATEGEGRKYVAYELGLAQALLVTGAPEAALAVAGPAAVTDPADPQMDQELDRVRALLLQAEIQEELGEREKSARLAREFLAIWRDADPQNPELERARGLSGAEPER